MSFIGICGFVLSFGVFAIGNASHAGDDNCLLYGNHVVDCETEVESTTFQRVSAPDSRQGEEVAPAPANAPENAIYLTGSIHEHD